MIRSGNDVGPEAGGCASILDENQADSVAVPPHRDHPDSIQGRKFPLEGIQESRVKKGLDIFDPVACLSQVAGVESVIDFHPRGSMLGVGKDRQPVLPANRADVVPVAVGHEAVGHLVGLDSGTGKGLHQGATS